MPERLAEAVEREHGCNERTGLDRFNTFGRPIDVRKAEPHRELVERQSERDAEDYGDPQVPGRRSCRKRAEAGRHEQHDAPEQMVDMEAAFRDDVAKGTAWE
jgi:hypothetical protein